VSAEQRAKLPALLARGAAAFGFEGAVWTASRSAAVREREFGVRYHRDHVRKLFR
jgi:transposase